MKNVTTRNISTVERKQHTNSGDYFEWTNDSIDELMLGMLTTALEEVRDHRKSAAMRREAKEWLMLDDQHSPFSALNCCRCLGLDLTQLRDMTNTLTNGELFND